MLLLEKKEWELTHASPDHRAPGFHRRGNGAAVQKAGHEVTGLDIGLYDGCDFGPPRRPSVRSAPICVTWMAVS